MENVVCTDCSEILGTVDGSRDDVYEASSYICGNCYMTSIGISNKFWPEYSCALKSVKCKSPLDDFEIIMCEPFCDLCTSTDDFIVQLELVDSDNRNEISVNVIGTLQALIISGSAKFSNIYVCSTGSFSFKATVTSGSTTLDPIFSTTFEIL